MDADWPAGAPSATLAVVPAAPGVQPVADARLWVPADLLYSLRLPAGTPALVRHSRRRSVHT